MHPRDGVAIGRRAAIRFAAAGLGVLLPLKASALGQPDAARLRTRWRRAEKPGAAGTRPLGLDSGRDGFLHVPPTARTGEPLPTAMMLHGAGGRAEPFRRMIPLADELGVVLVVPESRGRTWDAIRGRFGPDIAFLDRVLDRLFATATIDPRRVAVGGFSDGASYALAVGLRNGDLFSDILAFSPGFIPEARRSGKPRVFISHGTNDEILPIDRTSRRIVPTLRDAGYAVRYEEFDGPHTVPPDLSRAALEALVQPSG